MKQKKHKLKLKSGVAEKVIRGQNAATENAEQLTNEEFFGSKEDSSDLDLSDSDENTAEGLGDGNIGRPTRKSDE